MDLKDTNIQGVDIIKKSTTYIFASLIMLFLIILTISLVYSSGKTTNILITITLCIGFLIMIVFAFKYKPYFLELLKGIGNSKNVMYIVVYIIGLIMLYTILSEPYICTVVPI